MRLSYHLYLLSLLLLGAFLSACSEADLAESGQLELRNLTASVGGETPPGFFNDWLTMSRIATPIPERWAGLKVQDTAALRLANASAEEPLRITQLTLSPGAPFEFQRPQLPLEILPGDALDLTVTFTEQAGDKGVRRGTLGITSSGGDAQVQLAGVFMEEPEGDNEVNLQQIVDAFGYSTDVGLENERLSEESDSPLAGDEVRFKFWERADPGEPIYVRELATFHGCCDEENFIELLGRDGVRLGGVTHAASYAQSVLPLAADETGPAELTLQPAAQPTPAFEIIVGAVDDTYSTNTDGNLGVRLWPVKRDGAVVKDAYVIAEDYVQEGCGQNFANCDYQDNVFLITNVRPAP